MQQGIGQPLEDKDARAFTHHQSIRRLIERHGAAGG